MRLDALLAVAEEPALARLGGELVREPVFGMPACWVGPAERKRAEQAGALVFDPISIVGSHLAEVVRRHASSLLGRQELHTLLEHLRASVPSLTKEVGSDALPLATVQRVFERLLRERVWPRDPVAALEALVDAGSFTRDARELCEAVRRRLVPLQLQRRNLPHLEPLVVAPDFESELSAWLGDAAPAPNPDVALHLRAVVREYTARVPRERAAIVCSSGLRPSLAEMLLRFDLPIDVFAYAELPPSLELRPALVMERPRA